MIDFGDVGPVVDQYIEMNHCEVAESLVTLENNEIDTSASEAFQNDAIPTLVSLEDSIKDNDIIQRYGDGRAKILDVCILDSEHNKTLELIAKKSYVVQMSVQFNEDISAIVPAVGISSLDGVQQLAWISSQDNVILPSVEKGSTYIFNIEITVPIKAGVYNLGVAIEYPSIPNQQHQFLDVIKNVEVLQINFENP